MLYRVSELSLTTCRPLTMARWWKNLCLLVSLLLGLWPAYGQSLQNLQMPPNDNTDSGVRQAVRPADSMEPATESSERGTTLSAGQIIDILDARPELVVDMKKL